VLPALSGVPAAKDVGACCLPALHRWNAIESQLKFHVENVDNLRQWGVDVEQISIPTIVERSSSCNCEDVFVDALSELK
jgi:hypothetical protein